MKKGFRLNNNLAIIIAILFGVVLLIAFVPLLTRRFPAPFNESPEITKKRFGPENAFSLFLNAGTLYETIPHYRPSRASAILEEWGQSVVTDLTKSPLPELPLQSLFKIPSIEKMREGLSCPYFLWHITWNHPNIDVNCLFVAGQAFHLENKSDLIAMQLNSITDVGEASLDLASSGLKSGMKESLAVEYLLDGFRLAMLLQEDGDVFDKTLELLVDCVGTLENVSPRLSDDALLHIQETLTELTNQFTPIENGIRFLLLRFGSISNTTRPDWSKAHYVISRINFYAVLFNFRKQISKEGREMLQASQQPYPEFIKWLESKNATAKTQMDPIFSMLFESAENLALTKSFIQAWLNGAITITALERLHRESGNYPESLNELVPKWISCLPQDPFASPPTAMFYSRHKNGYELRCVDNEDGNKSGMRNQIKHKLTEKYFAVHMQ